MVETGHSVRVATPLGGHGGRAATGKDRAVHTEGWPHLQRALTRWWEELLGLGCPEPTWDRAQFTGSPHCRRVWTRTSGGCATSCCSRAVAVTVRAVQDWERQASEALSGSKPGLGPRPQKCHWPPRVTAERSSSFLWGHGEDASVNPEAVRHTQSYARLLPPAQPLHPELPRGHACRGPHRLPRPRGQACQGSRRRMGSSIPVP